MKDHLESTRSDLTTLREELEAQVPEEHRETEAWKMLDGQLRAMIHALRGLAERVRGVEPDDGDSEVELQLHLGLMEAKDRWNAVHPSLARIKSRAIDTGQKIGHVVRESIGDLDEVLRKLDESEAQRVSESRRDWEQTRASARRLAITTLVEIRNGIRSVMPGQT